MAWQAGRIKHHGAAMRQPGKVLLDTNTPTHHGADMRLTINLDDDLYAMARSHAITTKISISKAVGNLLRRRMVASVPASEDAATDFSIHPVTLLPVVRGAGTVICDADVQRALADEDLRHLEPTGPSTHLTPDHDSDSP